MNPLEWYRNDGWYLTSPYGPRSGTYAGFHRGIDLGGKPCGAAVKTPFSGRVTAAKTSGMGTWGNTVCIELDLDGEYVSLNAHLQSISVKEGQRVNVGDIIGTNGGTNHNGANYACHIHYEIQKNTGDRPWRGQHIDPAPFRLDQKPQDPSTRFGAGQIIKAIANLNIRQRPGTMSTRVGVLEKGKQAKIISDVANGRRLNGYAWWKIHLGWVAEDFIELVHVPDPEPVKPPELPEEYAEPIKWMINNFNILEKLMDWIRWQKEG